MTKILLSLACCLTIALGHTQCTNDYDWMDQAFGVSPDPEMGETFADGELNVAYTDVIHVLIPEDASDVVDGINLPIDSASLVSVVITQGDLTYTPEEFGLELLCNNEGTSADPCTFMGGQQGCGLLTGTPLVAGDFSVTIEATIYVTFFGTVQPYPFNYDGYTLFIDDGNNVTELEEVISEVRVTPNPFSTKSLVEFISAQNGTVSFKVFNLLGEEKLSETVQVKTGHNKLQLTADNLEAGVYLYHLQMDQFKVTKRLVVNK